MSLRIKILFFSVLVPFRLILFDEVDPSYEENLFEGCNAHVHSKEFLGSRCGVLDRAECKSRALKDELCCGKTRRMQLNRVTRATVNPIIGRHIKPRRESPNKTLAMFAPTLLWLPHTATFVVWATKFLTSEDSIVIPTNFRYEVFLIVWKLYRCLVLLIYHSIFFFPRSSQKYHFYKTFIRFDSSSSCKSIIRCDPSCPSFAIQFSWDLHYVLW